MKRILILLAVTLALSVPDAGARIRIGAMVYSVDDFDKSFSELKNAGFESCQVNYIEGKMTDRVAANLKEASGKYGIKVTTVVAVPGHCVWNFREGPATIGLVPSENREAKLVLYRDMIDFCAKAGVPAMHSHFGFIPEDMSSPAYRDFIIVMRELAEYAASKGIMIYMETGQETPITLVRAIRDVGTGNLFINCDLANLVMYGKANPLDAVKLFGPLVKEFHAKDGLYPDPSNPYELGREVSIPEGEVDFPAVIEELVRNGFDGSLTIERELAGEQMPYLLKTRRYLQSILDSLSDERFFDAPMTLERVSDNSELNVWRLEEGVTVIETEDLATMYLVEGSERALLIDTGTKCSSLKKVLAELTDKPVDVLVTHNHSDHTGNVNDFDRIYMHPADSSVYTLDYAGEIVPVEDGYVFGLGNRNLEVRLMPGHTPGSVVVIDRKSSACYTGDAFGSGAVWLQLKPHVPVVEYYASCVKMLEIMDADGISKLYCGHFSHQNRALGREYLERMKNLAGQLAAGNRLDSAAYPCSTPLSPKKSRSVTDGEVIIVYDPAKIN